MRKGFTLAEILITLSIIGVIASMTIPSLVQDIQDAQFKTAWKKTYSDLEQANRMVLLDNAGNLKNICTFNNSSCIRQKFSKYLNILTTCQGIPQNGDLNDCWTDVSALYWQNEPKSGGVLPNGALVMFDYEYQDCTDTRRCFAIWVDVNGKKGPNKSGKDVFAVDGFIRKIAPMPNNSTSYLHQ